MQVLETLLARAAAPSEWDRVVRRCAWCQRVADSSGKYRRLVPVEPDMVFTDGMCPECGAAALARIAARQQRAV